MRLQGIPGHVLYLHGAVGGVPPGRDVFRLGLPVRPGGVHRVGRGPVGIQLVVPEAGPARRKAVRRGPRQGVRPSGGCG